MVEDIFLGEGRRGKVGLSTRVVSRWIWTVVMFRLIVFLQGGMRSTDKHRHSDARRRIHVVETEARFLILLLRFGRRVQVAINVGQSAGNTVGLSSCSA